MLLLYKYEKEAEGFQKSIRYAVYVRHYEKGTSTYFTWLNSYHFSVFAGK